MNYVPGMSAYINGMSEDGQDQTYGITYFLDFNNNATQVWDYLCINYMSSDCHNAPTFVMDRFHHMSPGVRKHGNKETEKFNLGFENIFRSYWTKVCIGQSCRDASIDSVAIISQDRWYYNQAVNYGSIGFGPRSKFWEGLIDSSTNATQYSIAFSPLTPA